MIELIKIVFGEKDNIKILHLETNDLSVLDSINNSLDYYLIVQFDDINKHYLMNFVNNKTGSIFILNSVKKCYPPIIKTISKNINEINKSTKSKEKNKNINIKYYGHYLFTDYKVEHCKVEGQENEFDCCYYTCFYLYSIYKNIKQCVNKKEIEKVVQIKIVNEEKMLYF